jgi:hypothetical protein
MHQFPFAKDVFSDCPTQIDFNVSGQDAEAISKNWRWIEYPNEISPEDITALPRYTFYCQTFVDDEPKMVRLRSYPTIEKTGDEANPTKLIKQSLMRWGTKRRRAEKDSQISCVLGNKNVCAFRLHFFPIIVT